MNAVVSQVTSKIKETDTSVNSVNNGRLRL